MNVALTERALAVLASAEPAVQKAFIKQINYLARDLHHPSLRAKKYDEGRMSGKRASTTTGASISRSSAGRTLSATSFLTRNRSLTPDPPGTPPAKPSGSLPASLPSMLSDRP
jgi:hypothetical protein